MANSLYQMCLQGILVDVSIIILDRIFVFMNTTTLIPGGGGGWRVSSKQLAVNKRKDNARKFAHLTH